MSSSNNFIKSKDKKDDQIPQLNIFLVNTSLSSERGLESEQVSDDRIGESFHCHIAKMVIRLSQVA